MPAKKRGQFQAHTPFDTKAVAAMTRDLPNFLQKEGYFKVQPKVEGVEKSASEKEIKADMFDHDLIQNSQPEIKAVDKIKPTTIPQPVNRGNRLNLLYAVVSFGLVILSIWIFNARNTVSGLWANATSQNELLDKGTADFNSVLETIKNNDRIVREKLNENKSLDPFTEAQVQAALQEAIKPGTPLKQNP